MITQSTPISELMTPHCLCIDADLPLSDARDRMANEKIRHLAVMDDERLVGILSARDIILMETLAGINPIETPVGVAMNGHTMTCPPTTPLGEALVKMTEAGIGALPITEDGKLLGIFTSVNALRALKDVLVH